MFKESEKGFHLPQLGLGEGTVQSEARGWIIVLFGGAILDHMFLGGMFTSWLLAKLSAFL
jgi:hypothetical protein